MEHRKKSFATKRLGRISSNLSDAQGGLGQRDMPTIPDRWQYALLSCGSNAFGQIYQEDIMCSTLQITQIPGCIDENGESAEISTISCGSQITAAHLPKKGVYLWGSGIGSSNFRVPTLLKLPEKAVVSSISCGDSHAAIITSGGKVLTWGNGEHGALGHGSKQSLPAPKLVKALASLVCVSVSCGPYHTGFVAGDAEEISYVRVPPSASGACSDSADGSEPANQFLTCASLYTCGLGKTGQLGMGLSLPGSRSPRLVPWFEENGFKVAKVSCGMHHTLVIAVPVHAMRTFMTGVFSFGWGEHGRLGLGTEDGALEPTEVGFPEPFHAIDISAGEQHSLATSGKVGGCYAWGSNGFGQCGVGNPSQVEMCLVPHKVPVPEGMRISSVAAGGRHSGAVSACGQLLLWGWGEEGQLGNGGEKDSSIPRPCRVPNVYNCPSVPVSVSLGMCHTVVKVKNTSYRPATPPPVVEPVDPPPAAPEQEEEAVEETAPAPVVVQEDVPPPALDPIPSPSLEEPPPPQSVEMRIVEESVTPVKRGAVIVEEHEVEEAPTPVPIRSLRDILTTREERREKSSITEDVMDAYVPKPPSPVLVVEEEETAAEEEIHTSPPPAIVIEESLSNREQVEEEEEPSSKRRGSAQGNQVNYFYKDGQNLDNCFVANSAKRAELRKQKKQTEQTEKLQQAKVPATRPARKMSK